MSQLNDLIRDGQLPDITYRTNKPEELVHPRVVTREGVPTVYLHGERRKPHNGFIPVEEFLQRLADREHGLAVTGYRANGHQTTISFNKADRVAFSPRLDKYLSRLRGLKKELDDAVHGSSAFDEEAQRFLEGFLDPRNPQLAHWLPRYETTLVEVRSTLARGAYAELFELIWKSQDNGVSNAGQGVMGFEVAERVRERLIEVIQIVAADGSPASFDATVHQFVQWREAGELPFVPRLLIARAFATIHPELYHTTVDAAKQDQVITWFIEHTGFVSLNGSWAMKASALAAHLDHCGVFGGKLEHRNMFPWFVFEQMPEPGGQVVFHPGHTTRPGTSGATLPARELIISLRHNRIQDRLYALLCEQHGADSVRTEQPTGTGGFADAVVRRTDGRLDLYEIKVATHAANAVREAMGQLLEYAYRKRGLEPASLYVVSEPALDPITAEFLIRMNTEFGLKLDYLQVEVNDSAADNGHSDLLGNP